MEPGTGRWGDAVKGPDEVSGEGTKGKMGEVEGERDEVGDGRGDRGWKIC